MFNVFKVNNKDNRTASTDLVAQYNMKLYLSSNIFFNPLKKTV